MATLDENVALLATRIGEEFASLKSSSVTSEDAVLLTGAQTIAGTKTFSSYVVTDGGSYRVDMSADEPGTTHTLMYVKPYGYSYTPILRAVEPNGEGYGVVSDFGSRGNSIFGAGEGQESLLTDLATDGSENAYVCADSQVRVVTSANTYDNRGVLNFVSSGDSFYIWHYPRIAEVYKGDTPATSFSTQIRLEDSTGTNSPTNTFASVELFKTATTNSAVLRAYTDTSGSSDYATLGIYAPNGGGTAYTYAPTPASGDSSTKIATTAWVNNALSSGNAGTASALENPVTIQTNLASSSAASFDGTANVTPGVTGVLPVANGGTGSTAGAVLLTGNQTVAGTKTFSSVPWSSAGSFRASISGTTKGTAPDTTKYGNLPFYDGSGGTATTDRLGMVEVLVGSDGVVRTDLIAYEPTNGSDENDRISIGYDSNGEVFTRAPTPASGDSSTKIATTAWVNNALSSGNAGTASALENPVTIRTNLASTTAASFDGTANVTPGVTGVLPVANGGTGSTAGAVLLTGNQTVAGAKTFTAIPVIKGTSPNLYAQHTGVTKGTVPASTAYSRIVWHDSEGTASENRLGVVQNEVLADGGTATGLYAYLNESGSTAQANLRLVVPSTGTANAYATCPTPASGDSSTKIATTAWVNNAISSAVSNQEDGLLSVVASQLAQSGYIKLSCGLIIQWGKVTDTSTTITFPIAFTSACYGFTAAQTVSCGGGVNFAATLSKTGMTLYSGGSNNSTIFSGWQLNLGAGGLDPVWLAWGV